MASTLSDNERKSSFWEQTRASREILCWYFQDGFAPPEELEGDGLAPDDEEEY